MRRRHDGGHQLFLRPRVCLALRWRESRSSPPVGFSAVPQPFGSEMTDEDCSDVAEEAAGEGQAVPVWPSPRDAHTAFPSGFSSRLCVLRRRYTRASPLSLLSSGGAPPHTTEQRPGQLVQSCSAGEGVLQRSGSGLFSDEDVEVVGLGMRALSQIPPSSISTVTGLSHGMNDVVRASFLSIEDVEAALESPTASPSERTLPGGASLPTPSTTARLHRDPLGASWRTYSDARLQKNLADVIARELVGGSAASPPFEVLTFTMGAEGTASSSFLFGRVLAPAIQEATPTAAGRRPPPTACPPPGSLFASVLNRLFSNSAVEGSAAAPRALAISVVELRDAVPLRHTSVRRRPRVTVDLLSGEVLSTQHRGAGEAVGGGTGLDHPCDIPAASYVRVGSTAEAMTVLHTAFLSSVGWQPAPSPAEEQCSRLSPRSPVLLQPACAPQQERNCHVCVTVLVPHRDRDEVSGERQRPTRQRQGPVHNVGWEKRLSRLSPPQPSTSVGVWKLWDVAGPSVSWGYEGLITDRDGSMDAHRIPESSPSAGAGSMPKSACYSLAALTHTCFAEMGRMLRAQAVIRGSSSPEISPKEEEEEDEDGLSFMAASSFLRHDSTAQQIMCTALASCSLVVPIVSVVAEPEVDVINEEVLRTAAAWAAYGESYEKRSYEGDASLGRRRGLENAAAAWRVLCDFAVPFRDFMKKGHSSVSVSKLVGRGKLHPQRREGPSMVAASHQISRPLPEAHSAADKMLESQTATKATPAVEDCGRGVDTVVEAPFHAMTTNAPPLPCDTPFESPAAYRPSPSVVSGAGPSSSAVAILPADGVDLVSAQVASIVAPLSINVTSVEDSSAAFSHHPLPSQCRATLQDSNLFSPDVQASTVAPLEHNLATPLRPTLDTVSSAAASGDTRAEAATVPSIHRLRQANLSGVAQPPSRVYADAEVMRLAMSPPHVWTSQLHCQKREQQLSAPVTEDRSPPPIYSTGRRCSCSNGEGAHCMPDGTSAVPLIRSPHCASIGPTAAPDTSVGGSSAAASRLPPQRLSYESALSSQLGEESAVAMNCSASVAGGTDTFGVFNGEVNGVALNAAGSVADPSVSPYAVEMKWWCAQMRADAQAWRATEKATLDRLSALAEQHSCDLQTVAELQRRLPTGTAAAPEASDHTTGLTAAAGARTGMEGGISKKPLLPSNAVAVASSTSALIFEQLVKSEEKVAWLEQQLIEWRRRALDRSVLDAIALEEQSSLVRDGEGGADSALSTSPQTTVKAESTRQAVQNSRRTSMTAEAGEAQYILERLLGRCSRAYKETQQQATYWQAELAREREAKSALLKRVAKLEKEVDFMHRLHLAHHAQPAALLYQAERLPQREAFGRATHSAAAVAEVAGVADDKTARPLLSSPPSLLLHAASPSTELEEVVTRAAAPLSPIASDGAASLPSSSLLPPLVPQRESPPFWGRGLPTAADGAAGSASAAHSHIIEGVAADAEAASPSGLLSSQLAALLSLAVQKRSLRVSPFTRDARGGSVTAAPPTATRPTPLFEVHVVSSGGLAERGEEDATPPPSSCVTSALSSPCSSATAECDGGRVDGASQQQVLQQQQPQPPQRCCCGTTSTHCSPSTAPVLSNTGEQTLLGHGCGMLMCRDATSPSWSHHRLEEREVYPTSALEALTQAAAQLEADAVHLSSASRSMPAGNPTSRDGGGQEEWVDMARIDGGVPSVSVSPLCQSMGRLRSATQAVQREAREAAQRERAYLSTLLFSPTGTVDKR